jgi:CRISPR-associated protein Csb2
MMFAIGIRYLNGWVMAAHPADRTRPEWPPHPDRVFMALAAAHFEGDSEEGEREALEWLEQQGPPAIAATLACERRTVTTFVPVNDTADPIKKDKPLMPAGSLAIGRDRQPRQFPVAIPDDATVFLRWEAADPSNSQRISLGSLVAKVAAIGHSASLVQMWVVDGDASSRPDFGSVRVIEPVENAVAGQRLRIFGPGRLRQLRERFEAGLRPVAALWSGYSDGASPATKIPVPGSHFASGLLMLQQSKGPKFGLESTLQLTKALRDTVMSKCAVQPMPEWLTGHDSGGGASRRHSGHLAFLPLAHVGRQHADGHLLGLALAIPMDVEKYQIAECLGSMFFARDGEPIGIRLILGRLGAIELELAESDASRRALTSTTWTGPAKRWATITPIALDRHIKSKHPQSEAEDLIADGCERIGLPRPKDVIVTAVPMFIGVPHARDMPRVVRKSDGGQNRQTHAIVTFEQNVEGPVIVGAGRYRGYGFCRPLNREEEMS